MLDNTKQFDAIVEIKLNLEWLFADNPNVCIASVEEIEKSLPNSR